MKRDHTITTTIICILLVPLMLFSCASTVHVPFDATQEELEMINAKNLEVIATNTTILAGIQVGMLVLGAMYSATLISTAAMY